MVVAGFASVRVDGDILLRLNESLLSDVGVLNKVEQLRSVIHTSVYSLHLVLFAECFYSAIIAKAM